MLSNNKLRSKKYRREQKRRTRRDHLKFTKVEIRNKRKAVLQRRREELNKREVEIEYVNQLTQEITREKDSK